MSGEGRSGRPGVFEPRPSANLLSKGHTKQFTKHQGHPYFRCSALGCHGAFFGTFQAHLLAQVPRLSTNETYGVRTDIFDIVDRTLGLPMGRLGRLYNRTIQPTIFLLHHHHA